MMQVAANGAAGRMGRRIVSLVSQQDDMELTCALERSAHPALGQDVGVVAGLGELGVQIRDSISGNPEVLVDFSTPESTMARAQECADKGIALVLGTTGLSAQQREMVEKQVASQVPVVLAPNMSVGANLLFEVVGQVARALGEDYDVEILEVHHRRKKDAPSGTALRLAEAVCEALAWDPETVLTHGRHGFTGERPRRQVGVHSARGGDVVGDHTVLFAGEGERIELTHRASSRDVFARGALRATRFVAGRKAGLYTMRDVLFT